MEASHVVILGRLRNHRAWRRALVNGNSVVPAADLGAVSLAVVLAFRATPVAWYGIFIFVFGPAETLLCCIMFGRFVHSVSREAQLWFHAAEPTCLFTSWTVQRYLIAGGRPSSQLLTVMAHEQVQKQNILILHILKTVMLGLAPVISCIDRVLPNLRVYLFYTHANNSFDTLAGRWVVA